MNNKHACFGAWSLLLLSFNINHRCRLSCPVASFCLWWWSVLRLKSKPHRWMAWRASVYLGYCTWRTLPHTCGCCCWRCLEHQECSQGVVAWHHHWCVLLPLQEGASHQQGQVRLRWKLQKVLCWRGPPTHSDQAWDLRGRPRAASTTLEIRFQSTSAPALVSTVPSPDPAVRQSSTVA